METGHRFISITGNVVFSMNFWHATLFAGDLGCGGVVFGALLWVWMGFLGLEGVFYGANSMHASYKKARSKTHAVCESVLKSVRKYC